MIFNEMCMSNECACQHLVLPSVIICEVAKALIQFYCVSIGYILEYACQTFHSSLSQYLPNDIKGIQKRALRIIFPDDLHYSEALTTLSAERRDMCMKLFNSIEENSTSFTTFRQTLVRYITILEQLGIPASSKQI